MQNPPQSASHPRTILIVEDVLMVLWFAMDLVKATGHVALSAGTAAAAIDALESEAGIDGMLVDIGLPDMPGDKLVREVRRRRPALPIVIASGYGANQIAAALEDVSLLGFLDKPYDEESLHKAFRSVGVDLSQVS